MHALLRERRVTLTERWEPAGEPAGSAAEGDDDPFALRLPTLLLANKADRLADADAELRALLEVTGLPILPLPCRRLPGRPRRTPGGLSSSGIHGAAAFFYRGVARGAPPSVADVQGYFESY